MNKIEQIKTLLDNAQNICIIPHKDPDGDAIGSSMAMFNLFKNIGKNVDVVSTNEMPEFFKWLPNTEEIVIFERKREKAKEIINKADVIFMLDYCNFDRIPSLKEFVENNQSATKIMIDHHPNPQNIADIILSDTSSSSTAELVFKFIKENGLSSFVDKKVVECIFCGMMTDTMNFTVNSSNPITFSIVSELLNYNISKEEIYENVYHNFSENRMKLMGYALCEKMLVLKENKTAIIYLNKEELKKYNYQIGDTEGFVNMPFSIKGIDFCILILEKRDHIKLSFRSKKDIDVNEFAKKHFGGAGHKRASGAIEKKLSLQETLEKVKEIIVASKYW